LRAWVIKYIAFIIVAGVVIVVDDLLDADHLSPPIQGASGWLHFYGVGPPTPIRTHLHQAASERLQTCCFGPLIPSRVGLTRYLRPVLGTCENTACEFC
jgi:hypothetical protein